jgi:hypothetical protein
MSLDDGPEKYYANMNGPEMERFGSYFAPAVEDAWSQQRWEHFLDVMLNAIGSDDRVAFTAEACEMLADTSKHFDLNDALLNDSERNV